MSLYGGIEEMHSIGLQRTIAAVQEVEQAIDVQQETVHVSKVQSRDALIVGDRMEFATARAQREIAEWKQERLQQIRLEREMLKDEARKQYIASRLQSEQMKHVVNSAEAQAEAEAGRRAQTGLDDRFLARRRWSDAQEKSLAAAEIKIS